MFRHILVPIDLGPRRRRALGTALAMARQMRARVTLLHVIERIEHIPLGEMRAFYRRLEAAALRRLQTAARVFRGSGVPVRVVVMIGSAAGDIVRYAARARVDLVLMDSHRIDPRRPTRGWGTTSHKVGILSRCPVMLVK
jgi:nucleotide-binding universal stress UspA family protein